MRTENARLRIEPGIKLVGALAMGGRRFVMVAASTLWLLCVSPGDAAAPSALVLTQVPRTPPSPAISGSLDVLYPAGSRVVVVADPARPAEVRLLSTGLSAAGSPVVAHDAKSVLFVGREQPGQDWQIYRSRLNGRRPERLTARPGGAAAPDLIANGELVFISPAPGSEPRAGLPSVFAQGRSGPPRRLTFAPHPITDLTVLADGRILLATTLTPGAQAFFTVNNDGTEFALYAGEHARSLWVRRPREIGSRLAYLATDPQRLAAGAWAETVRTARPFSNPERLFPFAPGPCRSIEDGGDGTWLASFPHRDSWAVFHVPTNATALGTPLFDDPAWDDLEAVRLTPRRVPMGHISTMAPHKQNGTILCLNVNYTSDRVAHGPPPKAARVRVTMQAEAGGTVPLGEVAVQPDGSFLADVPRDVPLGFEALDSDGRVLRSMPPAVWLRAGENRTCIGCHEPHGRSPRNARPLAVRQPAVRLAGPPTPARPGPL